MYPVRLQRRGLITRHKTLVPWLNCNVCILSLPAVLRGMAVVALLLPFKENEAPVRDSLWMQQRIEG